MSQYHFKCTCPRCRDDLTPYGAHALHPLPGLNTFSLARDPFPTGPPTGTDLQSKIHNELALLPAEPTLPNLQRKYKLCKPLIIAGHWAFLAPFLEDCLGYYIGRGAVETLLVTALSTCRAHPVTHAPFSPFRLKGALAFVRALGAAVGEPSFKSRIQSIADKTGAKEVVDVDLLREVDPIAMARMVLFMVNHYLPATQEDGWPLAVQVREVLEEVKSASWGADGAREGMERWEGAERDAEWMGVWRRMAGLVDGFAELGARMIVADLEA